MLSDAEKAELEGMLDNVFDVFKESFVVFKTPEISYVAPFGNAGLAYQDLQANVGVEYTPISGVFEGSIRFEDTTPYRKFASSNIPAVYSDLKLKISVGTGAQEFIDSMETVVVDGRAFRSDGPGRPRGMFTRKYLDYYFRPVDAN